VIYSVLLRDLPYPNAHELYRVYTDSRPNQRPLSVADYVALEQQKTQFQSVAGYVNTARTFSQDGEAVIVRGRFVTWTYFSLLGITPARGRVFYQSDGGDASLGQVVISHDFWVRHLGSRDEAVGQTIKLDGMDYVVVGVLSPHVGPLEVGRDFFGALPIMEPTSKGPFIVTTIARLSPDSDPSVAAEELKTICRRIFPIWQASWQEESVLWGMTELKDSVVGDIGPTLLLVFGAVGFVLLIASANSSNLLLARATERSRELAVRAALGASRRRLMLHTLSESAFLALCGALVGLILTDVGIRLLVVFGADYLPRTQEVRIDGNVLLFLVTLTAGSSLLFGLIPWLFAAKARVEEAFRSGGRSVAGSVRSRRFQRVLVVAQFAIALPLLIGAGLLLASLVRLHAVSPGIDTDRILSLSMSLPFGDYPDRSRVQTFWNEALTRVRALPGVQAASLATARPPNSMPGSINYDLEDETASPGQGLPSTPWIAVMPDYFDDLDIPLIHGRLLNEHDMNPTPLAVVVDQSWAKRFFPGETAVGRRFKRDGCTDCPWTTVVGVVGDVKYSGLDAPAEGVVYRSILAGTFRYRFLLVRTAGDPITVLPSVRNILRGLDPAVPITQVATLDELMWTSLDEPRYLALLVGAFAVVSMALSIVGIYGVMSHFVQRHTKEIGIRMALGGGPTRVLRAVVGQGMRLVCAGVVLGVIGALFLTRALSSLLFEVGTTDLRTFVTVTSVLLVVALVACVLPARRAAAVDPVRTLRVE
jgi:predicted permease